MKKYVAEGKAESFEDFLPKGFPHVLPGSLMINQAQQTLSLLLHDFCVYDSCDVDRQASRFFAKILNDLLRFPNNKIY